MELKLVKEKDVPLLNRKRVSVMANFAGKSTPSKNDLRKEIAKLAKTKEDLISIRHVYQRFGAGEAKVIAHVYQNVDYLKSLEKDKIVKEEKAETPKAAEAPKEEKKEEVPAETPKEEPKAEEVPKEGEQ